ncbi:1-aminocyclopropane-1-carboxylate deaminase/D-cysteine desulfhydrase [Flavobacterium sp.]|uniref:1-aminocyclopropane-1-carboxylate deaminase/D-cysteine desulfhydrase n=1 Tax=Flavobacterium sp. TaxID=239 RepID=UPI00352793BD
MNQKVEINFPFAISLYCKRDDLLHPLISGNKFRKLKYNILEAQQLNKTTLVTFGGAFSNHIVATAAAGKENGFKTIGVIRGNELEYQQLNPTLAHASSLGMQFFYVDRETYRNKENPNFIESLHNRFGDFYLIPEGGTNNLAIKGCEEIVTEEDKNEFDYICSAVGTGGTISGIINSSSNHQKILGFAALKGDFLSNDIRKFVQKTNWEIISDYHFGGYGKIKPELVAFLNQFYEQTHIPLDPIYTGKMMFGIFDLIEKKYFKPNAKILAIHTGGLQGIKGVNQVLNAKNKEIIEYEI